MEILYLNSQIKFLDLMLAVPYPFRLCLFSITNYIQNKDCQDSFKRTKLRVTEFKMNF
jgi:hypothetical protein